MAWFSGPSSRFSDRCLSAAGKQGFEAFSFGLESTRLCCLALNPSDFVAQVSVVWSVYAELWYRDYPDKDLSLSRGRHVLETIKATTALLAEASISQR